MMKKLIFSMLVLFTLAALIFAGRNAKLPFVIPACFTKAVSDSTSVN